MDSTPMKRWHLNCIGHSLWHERTEQMATSNELSHRYLRSEVHVPLSLASRWLSDYWERSNQSFALPYKHTEVPSTELNKSLCCASSDSHCLVPLFLATYQLYVENNPSMSFSSSLSETEWILLQPSSPITMVLLSTAPKARLLSSSPLDLRHYFQFMNHYWSC